MYLSKYFVFFIFYSFLGWIYESCYCTTHEHSWQNRGFLYGPCVPIYGLAAVAAQVLFIDLPIPALHQSNNWIIFAVCAIGSFFLEYITSFVLEKLFHARWWDYSNLPLNINGRVCLIFTACFGVAGVVLTNYLFPPMSSLGSLIPPIIFELLSLIFMLLLGMDLALTVSALTTFAREFERINEMINAQIAEKYTALETNVSEAKAIGLEKVEAGKEAVGATTEKLAELKEQIALEYVMRTIKNASEVQKGQFRHIAKFTHPVASTKMLMEKGSNLLKNKRQEPR